MVTKEQKTKVPQSIRKHIREEKARIRRQFLDPEEQQEHIQKLYKQFLPKREQNPNQNTL